MRFVKLLAGLVMGALVGAVACVVHGGPVDLPLVGLVLACAIVASGAWFLAETGRLLVWSGYVIGVVGAAIVLLMVVPTNDGLVVMERWPSEVWLIAAPLSAILPLGVLSRSTKK
ncbi:hypothetical protein I6E29_01585 [Arcanobacterium haemolyticum]|nr:hypothetical protein [Arcanobacterium haemolyticum]